MIEARETVAGFIDQAEEMRRRCRMILTIGRGGDRAVALARAACAADVVLWCNDYVFAYNPNELELPDLPFVLFERQVEMMRWVEGIIDRREEGVLEKSREIGASWCMAMFALHRWLFHPGFRTTFGSYKAEKVDRRGDADSIFEKIRIAIDMLPSWMRPAGFKPSEHDNYMRLLNPENGNQIVGEVGENQGRGGRSSLYVLDEAAFIEHARIANRAISRNAEARIWASTPSPDGMASVFYEKRQRALQRDRSLLFRFHWRDDPRKTEAWATAKKQQMDPEDWAAEQEIDYSGATERQLIRQEWLEAAKELARLYGANVKGEPRSGLDVGAGKAESVLVTTRGPLVYDLRFWRNPDAVDIASLAIDRARQLGSTLVQYDATGVGFAQGAVMSRMSNGIRVIGVNVGEAVPEAFRVTEGDQTVPANRRFQNLKAFGWWSLRERAKASWGLVAGKKQAPLSECLLLAVDDLVLETQLLQPRWSKSLTGKIQVDKAPDGTKSPDRADATMLALLPATPRLPLVWSWLIGVFLAAHEWLAYYSGLHG